MNKQNVCPAAYIVNTRTVQMGILRKYTANEELNYALMTRCQSEEAYVRQQCVLPEKHTSY